MAGTLNVPTPAVLRKAGQREAAALAALLAGTAPGQSVHGARRRIKQLRSLLRLLRPNLDAVAYCAVNDALREAAAALAGHRRAEALVVAAAKLEGAKGQGSFWRDEAETHRAAHAAEGDPAMVLEAAREAINRAAEILTSATLSPVCEDGVGAAFLTAYGRARKLLRKSLKSGAPQALHDARKFVIHHLHQSRLLQLGSERRLAELEKLREILGDLNDLEELRQLADRRDVASADSRRMRRARSRLLDKAADAADRLFRHKPERYGKRLGHAAGPRSPKTRVALQAGE
jgi:hypothetical protein